LRSAGPSLAGVLPISVADGGDTIDRLAGFAARVYDAVTSGLHDRAAASVVKLQAAAEAASAGKMAAVAAPAAALATGGASGAAARVRVAGPARDGGHRVGPQRSAAGAGPDASSGGHLQPLAGVRVRSGALTHVLPSTAALTVRIAVSSNERQGAAMPLCFIE